MGSTDSKMQNMRRGFFMHNLARLLALTIVPVLCFSGLTLLGTVGKIKNEVDTNSTNALQLSVTRFDMMLNDMLYYRILVDYNPSTNLYIIKTLRESLPASEDLAAIRELNRTLFSLSAANTYIHSIYIANGNHPYMISNGERRRIDTYIDNEWFSRYTAMKTAPQAWLETRGIRNYSFDSQPTGVVTLYQRLRLNGVMAINLRKKYFDDQLTQIAIYPGQTLAVLNEDFSPLFDNGGFAKLPEEVLTEAIRRMAEHESGSANLDGHFVTWRPSVAHGLCYVSIIPAAVAYRTINTILLYTLAAVVVSVSISLVLAYNFTRQSYGEVYRIIELFEKAERGQPLSAPETRHNSLYFYIIENVANVFINQSYMREQLTARRFELLSAQFAALQYQINPHFLFNTLQSIDLEIHKKHADSSKASRMLSQLSAILRYSLDEPMKPALVQQEIEMTKNYMEIQKYRYGARFEVLWEYEEAALGCKALRLLLQPLLENVLSHALRTDGRPTLIKVRITQKGNAIHFKVIDNGAGIAPERLAEIRKTLCTAQQSGDTKHIGLANISRRLALQYPARQGLQISSRPGLGTRVSFVVDAE